MENYPETHVLERAREGAGGRAWDNLVKGSQENARADESPWGPSREQLQDFQ